MVNQKHRQTLNHPQSFFGSVQNTKAAARVQRLAGKQTKMSSKGVAMQAADEEQIKRQKAIISLTKKRNGFDIFNECNSQKIEVVFRGTMWIGYFNAGTVKQAYTVLKKFDYGSTIYEEFRQADEANRQKNPGSPSRLVDTLTEDHEKMSATKTKAAPKAVKAKDPFADEAPGRGRPMKNADKKITLLVQENPKLKGSKSRSRFALYKNGMTVSEYVELGGHPGDIGWDVKHKFISLH